MSKFQEFLREKEKLLDLARLNRIAERLSVEKDLRTAIHYIALNVCSSGEPARIYLARLDDNLTLHHVTSFGFSEEFIANNSSFNLLINPLLNEVITSQTVMIRKRDNEYLKLFADLSLDKGDSAWKSTVILPLLPNYAATISTRALIEDREEVKLAFSLLKNIVNLVIHQLIENPQTRASKGLRKKSDSGKELTERQALIIDLIRSGMTNIAIADKLGYSESLIRQETMIIYKKKGITGRRDLLDESSDDQQH